MTATATQGVQPKTTGVHHVTLRSTDIARSKTFYIERLGFPLLMETPDLFLFLAGNTAFGVRAPDARTASDDTFDPFRVGLDHLALACSDAEELHRVADALTAEGIDNTGVKLDTTLQKEYVAFRDPDGVKWEFYMAG
jgi:catechol 2,3-dioxygenase-like lactoylglutathione lyase family enzyme